MVKKMFSFPKFESLRGSTSACLKIGEILAIRKNLASFRNWDSPSYLTLLVDRLFAYASSGHLPKRGNEIVLSDIFLHA